MASEIFTRCALTARKGAANISFDVSATSDLAGTEMISNVQTFPTTAAAFVLGGLDSVQAIAITNMDATNNLIVGPTQSSGSVTNVISTIPPGKTILLHNAPTTLYGASSASTVDAYVAAVET
jgi:hypothetical protein